jgi:flagellar biogenesis protein FliO
VPNTLTVIFSLVGVITVIAVMFWAARRFQKKYGFGFGKSGKSIRIEEAVSVSPDSRLLIAAIDGRRYLIGTGNVRLLSVLGTVPAEDIPETAAPISDNSRKTMPIGEAFRTVLAQKLNGTNTNEEKDNVGKDS